MTESKAAKIHASRKRLENPYAYLNGEGDFDAIYYQAAIDVHESRILSGNPYAYLDEHGGYSEYSLTRPITEIVPQELHSELLLNGKKKGDRFTKREIANIVRKIHIFMWREREKLLPINKSISPDNILEPSIVLRLMGYNLDIKESLGQYSQGPEIFEVAGLINEGEQEVQVSRRFSNEIQRFTMSHELGHAVLHHANGLHRDRAQDGGTNMQARDEIEIEADIFAAYFLMPSKLLTSAFRDRFITEKLTVNDDSAFALGFDGVASLEKKCRTRREFARLLSSVEQYNGRFFHSLSSQFRVSTDAMAIRLEELNLICSK